MNRASRVVAFAVVILSGSGALPGQGVPAPKGAQADPIEAIVAAMRAAEGALKSVRLVLATEGTVASGLGFSTTGTLAVLRGEQRQTRSSVRFRFADGLEARMETATTAAGITLYQQDPVFGEVYVRVPPAVVADLEWAGTVLDRSDLPGMRDARADSPLGSAMVDGLRAHFDLAPRESTRRGDDVGVWLAGARRPGLEDVDPDLPQADRVELFVRDRDHALLEVVHYRGEEVLQRIEVRSLEVDVEIPAEVFTVDGGGLSLTDVDKHAPLWSTIENTIGRAEAKLLPADLAEGAAPPPECVRPSRRR